ncbi:MULTISPECIES: hypothetical protein [Bacillus cereus group]|uniref:hypothetical protein n=1 Tax=Bacillus cereus group TaxID=86661 RepID=UPI001C02E514|nr:MULTISPECIES: hypothetical protein [Bacillus cereus group]QWI48171.1 hypothetical protein EXW56_04180 [Bacillus mycoides]WJE21071.1 hypothetical protein QRY07_04775 [Bacillus cereus]
MILNSFSIVDFKNKEARNFVFKQGNNLIVSSGNTQGKSSLLKSLYFTLGFDVRQFPSGWTTDNMYFQLELEIDNSSYTITRQKDIFRVSDEDKLMNVKEYSEWLQKKININMQLANVYTKNLHNAYSSAIILPFYIDQDDSWDGVMYRRVSDTLGQYTRIPKDIFESIFSLSNLEITELQNKLTNSTKEKNIVESTITNFYKIVEEYKEENINAAGVVKIDKVVLNNDINHYLSMVNKFNEEATKYKLKLLNKQELLDLQKQELSELEQLLIMNRKRYKSIKAECKYCHSQLTVEQSLTRLNLSNNEFEISLLKDEVKQEIEKFTKEIKELRIQQVSLGQKIDEINTRIQKSKKLLTIDDYVKESAKNEAVNEMENLIDKQIIIKHNLEEKIKKLRKQIKELNEEKQELRTSIEKDFDVLISKLKGSLTGININELKFLDFKKIAGSGMDKNKKYLAYYLVYFNLLEKYSSYRIPFCMDSFIKNEISGDNANEMFSAIEEYFFSNDNQTFFSIVSENLRHLKHEKKYNKIEVDGKLLSKDMYTEISSKLTFKD